MLRRRARLLFLAALAGVVMLLAQVAIAADHPCGTMPMDEASCAAQCIAQGDNDNALPAFGAALPSSSATMSLPPVRTGQDVRFERDAPRTGRTLQVLYCSYQK